MRGCYRWWIGALLFASTVINYLDRQTLSVLGPYLKVEFRWSNENFGHVLGLPPEAPEVDRLSRATVMM